MHGLVYRSRFVQEARRLIDLRTSSRYFAVHWPMYDSPYQLGYEQLESVRRAFGPKWGEIVGVEVVLHDLRSSRYFAVHWPMYDSPYQLGYEQLESVRRAFGPKWGEIVGVEVVLHDV